MTYAVDIPPSARMRLLHDGISCRLAHRYRWLHQKVLRHGDLSIAGGYHCGNLGDMALGEAVRLQATNHFDNPQLKTIYDLQRWPLSGPLVVGGGAVAYRGPLNRIAALYKGRPGQVAFLGVDFNDVEALEQNRDFYQQAAWIGCRSAEQSRQLETILPKARVGWTYDLAFSLAATEQACEARSIPVEKREKIFGFSMVPFMVKRQGNSFIAGSNFLGELQKDRPDLIGRIDELAEKYANWMRRAVSEMLEAGYRAVHIPFTPDDAAYASACLQGLSVEYRRYRHTPLPVIADLGRCRYFLSARYHSLIFSLITQTPVVAFEYATKCGRLLDDLGFHSRRTDWDQLLSGRGPDVVATAETGASVLETGQLAEASGELLNRMSEVFAYLHSDQFKS